MDANKNEKDNNMDIKAVYEQLTSINIEQQKQIWDERGKGYYGEYLLFAELYKHVAGNGKILMNLNIPVNETKTTEIDLILIHETGLYVFEIKHYKGTIYGKDTDTYWTQYFRTVKNSRFRNPVEQNKYHIQALSKLLPEVPIKSCIVFTSSECDVRVTNSNPTIDICEFHNVYRALSYRFSQGDCKFSMEEIDNLFVKLSQYSKMQEKIVIDSKEASFFSWVEPVISSLKDKKQEVEQEKQNLINNSKLLNKTRIWGMICNIIVAIICVLVSALISKDVIQTNNNELNSFKQKFLHVDEIDNQYIDELNSYVTVSDVSLRPLTDDAVSFMAKVTIVVDTYEITFTQNSKYIVMTNSGKIFEYDLFSENSPYYAGLHSIKKTYNPSKKLGEIQFYGISNINDITYIKINGIRLSKIDVTRKDIKENLEIELYSK